jgi:hypothetical protein
MAINKKEIFEIMFSGIGPDVGLNLSNLEGDLTGLLKTEFPREHQQAIMDIAGGILARDDYSFIPSQPEELEELAMKWEAAYRPTLDEFKTLTDSIFANLGQRSIFEQKNITNNLEYKRTIRDITKQHLQCYSDNRKEFEERFASFEKNDSNKKVFQDMDMNMSMHYRLTKDSRACPVDAFAKRVKSSKRIAEKIARKWVTLIDEIESCRREKKPFSVKYDHLLLTDILGLLILGNRDKALDIGLIYVLNPELRTIEDKEDRGRPRQLKLIDTKKGIIYDCHIFKTLPVWIDYEFTSEKRKEILTHEEYVRRKLEATIKKDTRYQKIIDEIYKRALNAQNMFYTEKITETVHQTYMGMGQQERVPFLYGRISKLEKDLTAYRLAPRGARKKEVGLPDLEKELTEIIKCHNEEIKEMLNFGIENIYSSSEYNHLQKEVNDYMVLTRESVRQLAEKFEKATAKKYKTTELSDVENSYFLLSRLCFISKEMEERYQKLKSMVEKGLRDEDAVGTIRYFKNILTNFPTDYPGNERLQTQVKFNTYKYLVGSYKIFLNNAKEPNKHSSDGLFISMWQKYNGEFDNFVQQNQEKLGAERVRESETIIKDKMFY